MNDLVETVEYKGHQINIHNDRDAWSPDEWGNDDMFIVYDHRQFSVERKGYDPDEIFQWMQESKRKLYEGQYWVFPVYAYIHSGVALSLGRNRYPFNDQWDVSFRGFALVQRVKGWTWTEAKAYKAGQSLIEEWNTYLSGEVYGYTIEPADESELSDHCDDSCWGFYGDYEKYILPEVKSIIDHHIKDQRIKHWQYLKEMIRNKVPLYNRRQLSYL